VSPRLATPLVIVLLLAALGAYSGSSLARDVALVPEVQLTFESRVVPSKLSRTEPTPIRLDLRARIATPDGSRPPAVREFAVGLDDQVAIDARGLSACKKGGRAVRFPDLESLCGESIVGRGRVGIQFQFPEQPAIPTKSKVVVYNAGIQRTGATTFYAVADVLQPITTRLSLKIEITRKQHGSRVTIDVPKIANGAGSLTHLGLGLARRFGRNGKAVSLLTGRCRTGRIESSVSALFEDGTLLRGRPLQRCTPDES
jgi:hypothetical protein